MPTAAGGRCWRLRVPHHVRGARIARHRLTAALSGLVTAELLADAAAVAAELVGNAVRHAQALPTGVIEIEWRLTGDGAVLIRVTDGGSTAAPEVQHPEADAMSGRGLAIVEALATRWGVDRSETNQCVWAELCGLGRPSSQLPAPLG
ncbi:MAG: ATP-binding protein [Micromonosporaceae bacterium]|nr:ATP-binding protein [Micromonosporaceae bacterium]